MNVHDGTDTSDEVERLEAVKYAYERAAKHALESGNTHSEEAYQGLIAGITRQIQDIQ